jgi:hypothetical protein
MASLVINSIKHGLKRNHVLSERDANILFAQIEAYENQSVELKKDAVYMANIWKQHRSDFGEIVNDYNGDADGVDFVANRILKGGAK